MTNESDKSLYLYMQDRMDEAYRNSPSGNWFQRWIPGVCKHLKVRCTHGDEGFHRKYRCVCMICGRSLNRLLPDICFFTGDLHASARTLGTDT